MSRPIRRIAPLAVAAGALAILAIPSVSVAASTTTCKISAGKARSLGPAYVTYSEGRPGFKVRGTSCSSGQAVIKSFHSCRLDKGKKGRCTKKVRGYSCTDKRPSSESIPTQFTGNVTCSNGSRRVIHSYQQNT